MGTDTGNVLWADGIRRLATITEATDYAEGVRRTSVAQFEKRGGQVVSEERYNSDVTDFRTQLTKLLNEAPDALHIAAQSEFTAGTIVKQSRELGYEGLYGITWSGGIGDNYSFDEDGEVVGLGNVVLEILPLAERSAENNGWKVLGTAPTE